MKGILMKPDMIKAIVEGRKTVTRRVIKPQPDPFGYFCCGGDWRGTRSEIKPRYQVGEVVYIKETLFRHPYLNEAGYVLDETPVFINQTIGDCLKWRWSKDILSAMFMPQEAARYFIKITDVRAERLQEITPEDCFAEGVGTSWAPASNQKATYARLWDSINGKGDFDLNKWVWRYEFAPTKED